MPLALSKRPGSVMDNTEVVALQVGFLDPSDHALNQAQCKSHKSANVSYSAPVVFHFVVATTSNFGSKEGLCPKTPTG